MRIRVVLVMLAVVILAVSRGQGAEKAEPAKKPTDRERAVKFLRDHVIGKTVGTGETVLKFAGGKVEGVTSGTDSFSNLVETADGFSFDVLSVSKLTNYDLDKDGKRLLPGRNEDGLFLTRYELTARRSTGKLVGISRIVSSTHKTFTAGLTVAVLLEVTDRSIQTRESSIHYEDFFAAKGTWKPGASESRQRFYLEDGKLRVEGENLQYDVDPETLKKTRTSDPPMKWSSKQAE